MLYLDFRKAYQLQQIIDIVSKKKGLQTRITVYIFTKIY